MGTSRNGPGKEAGGAHTPSCPPWLGRNAGRKLTFSREMRVDQLARDGARARRFYLRHAQREGRIHPLEDLLPAREVGCIHHTHGMIGSAHGWRNNDFSSLEPVFTRKKSYFSEFGSDF
jgi:hypothetical protein